MKTVFSNGHDLFFGVFITTIGFVSYIALIACIWTLHAKVNKIAMFCEMHLCILALVLLSFASCSNQRVVDLYLGDGHEINISEAYRFDSNPLINHDGTLYFKKEFGNGDGLGLTYQEDKEYPFRTDKYSTTNSNTGYLPIIEKLIIVADSIDNECPKIKKKDGIVNLFKWNEGCVITSYKYNPSTYSKKYPSDDYNPYLNTAEEIERTGKAFFEEVKKNNRFNNH